MRKYNKGARSERELIEIFAKYGFLSIRAAGSGVSTASPPDIILFKKGNQIALECKAWDKNRIAIAHDKYEALKNWEKTTGMKTMLAWKMPYNGWSFISLREMEKNPQSYSVTRKRAMEINRRLEDLI